jgi:glycosyltransferase involved in cell wall biosynthesis
VYVYQHGVDSERWAPRERTVGGTFKFLHVGGEASRKGIKEAMAGLRLAFPRHYDVELNAKIISQGWNIGRLHRINVINERMSLEQLIDLYYDNHVFVYPSYGEGFGLAPLQAMATGMPTITVPAWAPYADFLDPNLCIDSHMVSSPWITLHPGNMLKPDQDSVVEAMRYAYSHYDEVHARAQASVDKLVDYYSWDRITAVVFGDLQHRLENS